MKKWQPLEKILVKDLNFFKIFKEKYINPRNNKEVYFYHLQLSDWTIILPLLNENEIIMVKQYRAGAKKVFYEFPGGLINRNEDPLNSAKRELLEETGYTAEKFTLLNVSYPLPAFQTSKCYIYFAEGLKKVSNTLNLDDGEDIKLEVLKIDEIKEMLYENKLENSMMAFAFSLFLLKREGIWR